MAELIGRADLAVGAGGVMNWERCCLGLPTIAVDIAANQVSSLMKLAERGAVIHLGSAKAVAEAEIASSIRSLMHDRARTRRMSEIAAVLVDGEGCSRVHAAMSV